MTVDAFWSRLRNAHVPVIVGTEAAECGLACLAMVAAYYGNHTSMNTLRKTYSVSIRGLSLKGLIGIADSMGLVSRPIRTSLAGLKRIALPAILHWDFDHFVVLVRVRSNSVVLNDPARGRREIPLDELSKHFTGVVLEVSRAASFKTHGVEARLSFRHLWAASSGFPLATIQVLALSIALQIATFASPFYIQFIVDRALPRGDKDLLLTLSVGFGVIAVLQVIISALRDSLIRLFGTHLSIQITGNIVRHLLRLPVSYFERRHVGDIVSRVESTSVIQQTLTTGVLSSGLDGIMAFAALIVMLCYSILLSIIVILVTFATISVGWAFQAELTRRTEKQLISAADERSHILESIRAAQTIRLMGSEALRESSWRNLLTRALNSAMHVDLLQTGIANTQAGLINLSTIVVILIGALDVLRGTGMTVGMLLAFISFRQTFVDRTTSLIAQMSKFRLLSVHLNRLGDITRHEPEPAHVIACDLSVRGEIELRGVSFSYGAEQPTIVANVSVHISPGEFLAITGASGSGKTTLLKVLLGIRDPTAGSVWLDGHEATSSVFRQWRERVGMVLQDDHLLSGTIADNISFFEPMPDIARVERAARTARVHDDIVRMPMGYLSLTGDMGSALSGGQRQRVLLARALYREPKILILDEGTANLDPKMEQEIAQTISALTITRVIIAHGSALSSRADRLLHVKDGAATIVAERSPTGVV